MVHDKMSAKFVDDRVGRGLHERSIPNKSGGEPGWFTADILCFGTRAQYGEIYYRTLFMASSSLDLATMPVICSTISPSLKKIKVGIA